MTLPSLSSILYYKGLFLKKLEYYLEKVAVWLLSKWTKYAFVRWGFGLSLIGLDFFYSFSPLNNTQNNL